MSDTTKETKEAQPHPTDNMGYPEAPETTLPETSTAPDTQTIINDAIKQVTVDDSGKYVYPENMDPVLKAAVAATKSYRDNQSGFTKSQQALKESEAVNEALQKQIANTNTPLELTPEVKQELSELLQTDPNAWRRKVNELEAEHSSKTEELTEEARTKARGESELERRYSHLEQVNIGRKNPITPELLDTDIPPRITQKLADGDVTFENYIAEVVEYLDAGKVVSKTGDTTTTDLNKANGSEEPSEADKTKQGELDYSNMTF